MIVDLFVNLGRGFLDINCRENVGLLAGMHGFVWFFFCCSVEKKW